MGASLPTALITVAVSLIAIPRFGSRAAAILFMFSLLILAANEFRVTKRLTGNTVINAKKSWQIFCLTAAISLLIIPFFPVFLSRVFLAGAIGVYLFRYVKDAFALLTEVKRDQRVISSSARITPNLP